MLMEFAEQLDLSGLVEPFSLAVCKGRLSRLAAGMVLEIRLQDPETFQDLLLIVERSGDQVLAWEKRGGYYLLRVRKDPGKHVAL